MTKWELSIVINVTKEKLVSSLQSESATSFASLRIAIGRRGQTSALVVCLTFAQDCFARLRGFDVENLRPKKLILIAQGIRLKYFLIHTPESSKWSFPSFRFSRVKWTKSNFYSTVEISYEHTHLPDRWLMSLDGRRLSRKTGMPFY